jgi:predicted signal transduction protein with EAL and GGDEF domain
MEVPQFGRVTASFGVATFPSHASSRDTLVVAADRALYNSKDSGRNRVSLPTEESGQFDPIVVDNDDHVDLIDAMQRL